MSLSGVGSAGRNCGSVRLILILTLATFTASHSVPRLAHGQAPTTVSGGELTRRVPVLDTLLTGGGHSSSVYEATWRGMLGFSHKCQFEIDVRTGGRAGTYVYILKIRPHRPEVSQSADVACVYLDDARDIKLETASELVLDTPGRRAPWMGPWGRWHITLDDEGYLKRIKVKYPGQASIPSHLTLTYNHDEHLSGRQRLFKQLNGRQ